MKFVWIALISATTCVQINEGMAQLKRPQIKRNNKRISSYTGASLNNHRYSGFGLSINALNYYGDLSPLPSKFSTDISLTKPAISGLFFRRFGPRYTLLTQLAVGTLTGSDSKSAKSNDLSDGIFRYKRNLSFQNRIQELSIVAVFDLFENTGRFTNRVSWTPYVYVGLALFHHNPKAIAPQNFLDGSPNPFAGKLVELRPLGTEGQYTPGSNIKPYSLIQGALPFGLGARVRLTDALDLWFDVGARLTTTDYLDDVSHNYIDLDKIESSDNSSIQNKLAAAMSYRTNEVLGTPDAATQGAHYYTADQGSGAFYTWPGYGSSGQDNWRGRAKSRDVYVVTSFKLSYILQRNFHKAKFR